MTIHQNMAIWEMQRQGLQQLAQEAEQCWQRGESVRADGVPRAPRLIWTLVEQANRQLEGSPV